MLVSEIDRLDELGMSDFYDREGRRIGLGSWVCLNEDPEYKGVMSTYIMRPGRVVHVSTIWLGSDPMYGIFGKDRPPRMYETMAFTYGTDVPWWEAAWDFQFRDCTEEDAAYSHLIAVSAVLLALKPTKPSLKALCAAVLTSGLVTGILASVL